jgi:hypothetical protein
MSETSRRLLSTVETSRAFSSIDQFCIDHDICRAFFYKLQRQGRGPAVTKLGTRTVISAESAAAWRRRMEAETPRAAAELG